MNMKMQPVAVPKLAEALNERARQAPPPAGSVVALTDDVARASAGQASESMHV